MINTNTVSFQQNLSDYLNQAVLHQDVINVNTQNGNAVLLSEEEYNSLKETIYLLGVPGMKERLLKDKDIPVEECEEFEW
ncbi:MAG: type II toxin-antitoxin system Phd/YefM family antitoxin [Oscillospiraceae bacterium]|jgi:prevent-host-death family protein|nr:type II toxin-antitoxin system Phd/YefM family antitoxin [Oscillospiraceae bacterium]